MRIVIAAMGTTLILACSSPGSPSRAQSCANDYLTIEMIRGTIMAINPAPEPFKSADIDLTGPAPCTRMWMQVLKKDAERCHAGGWIEVRGVVTADVENNSWEIGPTTNEYMTLGDDFTCE
jgi:hypothetical protein